MIARTHRFRTKRWGVRGGSRASAVSTYWADNVHYDIRRRSCPPAQDFVFEQRRSENYRELRKPLDPTVFIADLRQEMTDAPTTLNTAVPSLDWLTITDRASGVITLTKCEAAPEPRNLRRVKAEGPGGPP